MTTKEGAMFNELTKELLDLTAEVQGESKSLYAMVVNNCCCSCCHCIVWC
jgi:hypothetical protein